jgi:high-affinity Fe2+/Pb2+ permease
VCTIAAEQITLTRQGFRGKLAGIIGQSIAATLLIYAGIGLTYFSLTIYCVLKRQFFVSTLFFALSMFFWIGAWRCRNNSATTIIERKLIQSISVTKPIAPLTRGYFTVHFLENARLKKRLIILPGVAQGGQEEFENALAVFRNCGLTLTPSD